MKGRKALTPFNLIHKSLSAQTRTNSEEVSPRVRRPIALADRPQNRCVTTDVVSYSLCCPLARRVAQFRGVERRRQWVRAMTAGADSPKKRCSRYVVALFFVWTQSLSCTISMASSGVQGNFFSFLRHD